MSAMLITQDSRLKTLAVLLPVWLMLIYVASEMASEEYLSGIALLGAFSVVVLLTAFMRTVRLETAIVGMLLVGYLIGNRGFAQLALIQPIFVGEMCLGILMVAMLIRFFLARETPALDTWLPRIILIFMCMGGVHFLFNFKTYHLDAVRDFAIVYYASFFFIVERLGRQEAAVKFFDRALTVGFLGLAVITILLRVSPETILSTIQINGNPLFVQKDDLTATFAVAAVFFFYLRPPVFGKQWLRVALVLLFMVFIINGVARAAIASVAATSLLCWVANKRSFFLYPIFGAVVGMTLLAGYSVTLSGESSSELTSMRDKLISMVDVTGDAGYVSDTGDIKSGNNEFRRVFWQSVIDETYMGDPVFGLGFGYDFYPRFQQIYGRGAWDGLRSPHSYFVTIFGRMGYVGLSVLILLSVKILYDAFRVARAVRYGRATQENLFYWCAAVAILISASFGVVLEGPMGAIVFWSLLGMAYTTSRRLEAPVEDMEALDKRLLRSQRLGRAPMLAGRS